MFGTWRVDSSQKTQALVEYKALSASSIHQACELCREKKIKCSGDAEGCSRCRSQHLNCHYPESRRKRRGDTLVKTADSRKKAGFESDPATPPAKVADEDSTQENGLLSSPNWETFINDTSSVSGLPGSGLSVDCLEDLMATPDDFTMTSREDQMEHFGDFIVEDFDSSMSSPFEAFATPGYTSTKDHTVGLDALIDRTVDLTTEKQTVGAVHSKKLFLKSSFPEPSCQCLTALACLLNRLTMQDSTTEVKPTDKLVELYRKASSEVLQMSRCPQCVSRPEVMVVTGTVTQHLGALCEAMLDRLLSNVGETFALNFGSVRLNEDSERALLSQAVVCLQFRNFHRLLEMLGRVGASSPAAAMMFRDQQRQLSALKQRLDRKLEALENEI